VHDYCQLIAIKIVSRLAAPITRMKTDVCVLFSMIVTWRITCAVRRHLHHHLTLNIAAVAAAVALTTDRSTTAPTDDNVTLVMMLMMMTN